MAAKGGNSCFCMCTVAAERLYTISSNACSECSRYTSKAILAFWLSQVTVLQVMLGPSTGTVGWGWFACGTGVDTEVLKEQVSNTGGCTVCPFARSIYIAGEDIALSDS
jgi:hypothetical protein